jgi:glycosyltransferase involved in cell wall biosynthesis
MRLHLVMTIDMKALLEEKVPGATARGDVFFLERTRRDFKDLRQLYSDFIREHIGKNDILHFIEQNPLIRTHQKTLVTLTASSMKNYNLVGRAVQYSGVFLSDRIDVLDPNIFKALKKIFFYKRNKITLTSNSFCELEEFDSVPWQEKKDWLVCVGRFSRVKQMVSLLRSVPELYAALKNKATNDLHFYFIGHGELQARLNEILSEPAFKGLPVTLKFSSQPQEILRYSKIFFSVQLYNNYPSRALIEGMSAQNIPVVTDNGQTRWLAKPEFSYYVPEDFTTHDIVKAVEQVYATPTAELEKKSLMARELVLKEHTVERMSEYYADLYNKMSQSH